ncbi:MAG: hypothetical protein ACRENP_12250 [Longimicrobiales bacterium]
MATGPEFLFAQARDIALNLVEDLRPVVELCKVAGSLRRRRATVKDLELVVMPRAGVPDLLGNVPAPDVESIRAKVIEWGEPVKGCTDKSPGKYMQVTHVLGYAQLTCDVFVVTPPANFWSILAIRTGPAALGHVCVTHLQRFGMVHDGGRIIDTRTKRDVLVESEEDFFRLCGMPFYKPHLRDSIEARTPLPASVEAKAIFREACS